ncbi:hypothetical protein DL768_000820 [Monosporascus sp. mg162]|nr:hypothetical protein DL768_000820 [Monosporascus sp. mg162]
MTLLNDYCSTNFEECVVTYRCLHQDSVAQWLSQVVENAQAGQPLHKDMGHAKAAIVMTILAIVTLRQNKIRKPDTIAVDDGLSLLGQSDPFFCAATSLTEEEKGLPTLESAQARVLQVLYLLQTARMNQAWRQAVALKLVYCHAIMHANRPFLLEGTVATGSEETAPLKDSIEECINAARVALETVDAMAADDTVFHAFWWTPYATFCALTVVYVWEIQVGRAALVKAQGLRGLLELAERCRQHLAKATWEDSPSRRYSVVLEELRQEAKYQTTKTASQHTTGPRSQMQENSRPSSQDLSLSATATNMTSMGLDAQVDEEILSSQQGGTLSEASLFGGWQTADWLDLDSLVFGPFSAFEDFSNLPM